MTIAVNVRLQTVIAGVAMLIVGAGLLQISVLSPLAAAEAHAPVRYWAKALVFVPTALFAGVFSLIAAAFFPSWVEKQAQTRHVRFGERSIAYKLSVVAVVAVMLALGFALRWWLLGRLRELGYP